jgi:hypothetical protein
VSCVVGVLGGMAVRGTVAAQGDTAFLAGPQMDPAPPDLDAFFALMPLGGFDGANRSQMGAGGSRNHSASQVGIGVFSPRTNLADCCKNDSLQKRSLSVSRTVEATS